MFSRISLDKLLNKIDQQCIERWEDILEAVHGRFEHHCSWQFDLQ